VKGRRWRPGAQFYRLGRGGSGDLAQEVYVNGVEQVGAAVAIVGHEMALRVKAAQEVALHRSAGVALNFDRTRPEPTFRDFLGEGGKAIGEETRVHGRQVREHLFGDFEQGAREVPMVAKRSDQRGECGVLACGLVQDIEAETDDDGVWAVALYENASDLAVTDQDIVGPAKSQVRDSVIREGASQDDADAERKRGPGHGRARGGKGGGKPKPTGAGSPNATGATITTGLGGGDDGVPRRKLSGDGIGGGEFEVAGDRPVCAGGAGKSSRRRGCGRVHTGWEAKTQLMRRRGEPSSTESPGLTLTAETVPAWVATMKVFIFMASTVATCMPSVTA
jgi:hypothetical protein